MTTIVEALQDATAELHNAALAMQAIRDQVATQLAQTTGNTTTIVNNFLTRPLSTAFYIDPVNGSDANDGATLDTPMKTVDAAMPKVPRDGFTTFLLLGDCTISRYWTVYAPLTFFGIQRGNGAAGAAYSAYLRRITFASEAANSPIGGVGRVVAGFNVAAPYIRYQFVDVMLGAPIAGIDDKCHHNLIGSVLQMSSCNVNAPSSGALSSLLETADGAQSSFWFSGSLGANAPGHLVKNVAAGGNPNATYLLQTNLTTA